MLLKTMIVDLNDFWLYIVFRFVSIFYDMNMNRSMIVGVEHENKAEQNE